MHCNAGTGKSHFRALVSGKSRPAQRQSTALATEADQIIPAACVTHDFEEEIVEFHRNKSGSKVKWLVVSSKKLSLLIAKTIHNQTKGRYLINNNIIIMGVSNFKLVHISYRIARKFWWEIKFGSLAVYIYYYNRQIKIRQKLLYIYILWRSRTEPPNLNPLT